MTQYFIKYVNQASVNHKSSRCLPNFILHRNGTKLVLISAMRFFCIKLLHGLKHSHWKVVTKLALAQVWRQRWAGPG